MRNAPSVVYPVGRCRFYAVLLVVLAWLSLAVLGAWCWPLLMSSLVGEPKPQNPAAQAAGLMGVLLWLGWVAFAVFTWRRSPTGQLHWDAHGVHDLQDALASAAGVWRWRSAAYPQCTPLQQVVMVLDLQDRVLLRLRILQGAHSWVWVERASDPARWLDMRRALVATRA